MGESASTQTSVLLSDTLRLATAKKVRTISASLVYTRIVNEYTHALSVIVV